MTVQARRLGAVSNVAANTRVRAYTVPAGKRAIITTVTQSSDVGGAQVARMALGTNSDPGPLASYEAGFLWDQAIPGEYTSKNWPLATVMYPGDFLNVEHSSTGMYTMIQGVELDADREGANLWRYGLLSVEAARKSVTVPAGKRFRLREVVACSHSGAARVDVSFDGPGYPLKASLRANEALLLQTDLSAEPGQVIASRANGSATHVFLSGVMEDA